MVLSQGRTTSAPTPAPSTIIDPHVVRERLRAQSRSTLTAFGASMPAHDQFERLALFRPSSTLLGRCARAVVKPRHPALHAVTGRMSPQGTPAPRPVGHRLQASSRAGSRWRRNSASSSRLVLGRNCSSDFKPPFAQNDIRDANHRGSPSRRRDSRPEPVSHRGCGLRTCPRMSHLA
jgi:hypothetical protein